MHRPGLSRKPLVGEKGAPRVIVYPCGVPLWCTPVEGGPDYRRMEQPEHDGSPDWPGTLGGPIVLGFDGNRWNRFVGLEPEHVPYSLAG
jgi:hypothetical protein